MKEIHIFLIFSSLASFIGRVALSEFRPKILQKKFYKITPHVLDTLLLISGVVLIIQENWLSAEFGWIVSKFIILLIYIMLGVMCMRSHGQKRWWFFAGALASFAAIFVIAVTKHGFI